MKNVNFTGSYIFNQISTLKKQIDELYEAKGIIEDELGRSSNVWYLLDKQYKEKKLELSKLEDTKYQSV